MSRQRKTWKSASPPPATPSEQGGYEHPATYEDPGAHDYENGDTSSWAEDVHPGPYDQSPHPATPDEGPFHPAGVGSPSGQKTARAAAEKKAAKCIRIATAMLGEEASVEAIENQAFDLMSMEDHVLNATLSRISGEDEEEEDEGSDKEASSKVSDDRFAALEGKIDKLSRALEALLAGKEGGHYMEMDAPVVEEDFMAGDDFYEGMEEDAMLEEMLMEPMMDEEPMMDDEDKEAEAMFLSMMEEMKMAGKKADEDEEEEEEEEESDDSDEEEEEEGSDKEASLGDFDIDLGSANVDLMGLADGGVSIEANDSVLASLFADEELTHLASEQAEALANGREASASLDADLSTALKPQPKTAGTGATSLGKVQGSSKTAASEIGELASLWKTEPNVSEFFSN